MWNPVSDLVSNETNSSASNPPTSRRAAALVVPLAYAIAAILFTWPLAYSPGVDISARPDYYINLWNLWWVGQSVWEGVSPYSTELLHFPNGVSLARHTLSLGNSVPGALLGQWLSYETAFEWLLLIHFWLSGWAAYALAREVSGSRTGAFIAGLLWAFSPFHTHYLAQLNISTLEFLPLVALFLIRMRRDGGARNALGVVLCVAALGLTSWYYLVYAGIFGALFALFAFLEYRDTPFVRGTLRLLTAGLGAGLLSLAIGWPLLSESGSAPPGPDVSIEDYIDRSNDLLGFRWIGPPEVTIVSWPTMLCWTALFVVLAGWRGLKGRGFWILVLAVFFVLGLGPRLTIGGELTGIELPYAWIDSVPVLSMLRKPDRFQVMMQLAWIVLVACCWRECMAHRSLKVVRALFGVCVFLVVIEIKPGPLETFESAVPKSVSALRADTGPIVHLPASVGRGSDSLANLWQTVHERPIPQGYITSLALSPGGQSAGQVLDRHWKTLERGRAQPLVDWLRKRGVTSIVLHNQSFSRRARTSVDKQTIWMPFAFSRRELLHVRASGPFEIRRDEVGLRTARRALEEVLGAPAKRTEAYALFEVGVGPTQTGD